MIREIPIRRAVLVMLCMMLTALPARLANAQALSPDPVALMITRLASVIPDIADQTGDYSRLRSDILEQWDAVPAGLLGPDGLALPWEGEIRAAPFGEDNALARLNLTNVPQDICVELGFLTLGRARIAGFYINGDKLTGMPSTLGDFMVTLAGICPPDPSMIDIIIN